MKKKLISIAWCVAAVLFITLLGLFIALAGPFSWWLNLIVIIVGIALILVTVLGLGYLVIKSVTYGIGYARQTDKDAWDYWEKMKVNKWEDLSDEEKMKMVSACYIINADCGMDVSNEQIISALKEQLPITDPHIGLK